MDLSGRVKVELFVLPGGKSLSAQWTKSDILAMSLLSSLPVVILRQAMKR